MEGRVVTVGDVISVLEVDSLEASSPVVFISSIFEVSPVEEVSESNKVDAKRRLQEQRESDRKRTIRIVTDNFFMGLPFFD